ncbi:MAG: lyase [Chloroflexota bacterium]|nr:lyase [Chloroflexota bacterium]
MHVVAPFMAGVFLLAPIVAGTVSAQATPVAETAPESCLTVETFPVLPGEHPHDVAPAADGQGVWYTAQHAGALGLLDPATGEIETIPLGEGSSPHGVVVGPDGAAWVTDTGLNAMVRVDAGTHELAVWPLAGENANLNTATLDPAGVVWFTGQNGIVGRLDPAVTPPGTTLEPLAAPRGQGPYGIDVTPEGEVYYASLAGSYLGRIVPGAGESFSLEEIEPPTAGQGTRRVWSDSHGVLWTSQWTAGQVGRYDPATGAWTEWRLPGDAPQAYAVYVDERDDVWLSDFGANALVRFDPDTETFAIVSLLDPGAAVRQILGRPGEVWGAESGADALVVVRTDCA